MIEKKIGKIESVSFGLGGYQDAMIGLHLTFSGKGWGVSYTKSFWDPTLIERTKNCKWTEEERNGAFSDIVRHISEVLSKAKVDNINRLKGIPVEVEFENNSIKNWRVLEEVL